MADNQEPDDEFGPNGRFAILNEREKGYWKLDRRMWEHYENNDTQCDEIAERLLLEPDLPIYFRVRALIILSTLKDSSCAIRARKAFELMDVDMRKICDETNTPFPSVQFEMAKEALEIALKVEQELKAEAESSAKPTSVLPQRAPIAVETQAGSAPIRDSSTGQQAAQSLAGPLQPQFGSSTIAAEVQAEPSKKVKLMHELAAMAGTLTAYLATLDDEDEMLAVVEAASFVQDLLNKAAAAREVTQDSENLYVIHMPVNLKDIWSKMDEETKGFRHKHD